MVLLLHFSFGTLEKAKEYKVVKFRTNCIFQYRFVIFPFIWIVRGTGVRKTVVILPIFVYHRESENEHGFTIAFLIWYTRKSEKVRKLTISQN